MTEFNTNRANISWTIENNTKFWKNQFWHNIQVQVYDQGKHAEYKCTITFEQEKIDEIEYWTKFGKKIAELLENIDLARRLETVK